MKRCRIIILQHLVLATFIKLYTWLSEVAPIVLRFVNPILASVQAQQLNSVFVHYSRRTLSTTLSVLCPLLSPYFVHYDRRTMSTTLAVLCLLFSPY